MELMGECITERDGKKYGGRGGRKDRNREDE